MRALLLARDRELRIRWPAPRRVMLTALLGGSFGQLALRIVVARLDGRPVNLLQALGRTALICLVVPPLIFNRDNRGLHDLAFGTIALNQGKTDECIAQLEKYVSMNPKNAANLQTAQGLLAALKKK